MVLLNLSGSSNQMKIEKRNAGTGSIPGGAAGVILSRECGTHKTVKARSWP